MQDKIYSRWRIELPNFKKKRKKISRPRLFIFMTILICIVCIASFLWSAYPVLKASCENAASSVATRIINEEVMEVMKDYSYHDLTNIQIDDAGKVKLIEANVITLNSIISKINLQIQERIDKNPRTTVFINLGSVTGISFLSYFGPKFNIELETGGTTRSNVKTELEAMGINQTLHKIYLNVNTRIAILTPFGVFAKELQNDVLLAEAVIVGDVPSSYYDFDGITKSDEVLEVIE